MTIVLLAVAFTLIALGVGVIAYNLWLLMMGAKTRNSPILLVGGILLFLGGIVLGRVLTGIVRYWFLPPLVEVLLFAAFWLRGGGRHGEWRA